MRILITGVRGFVGRHLAAYCLQDARNEVWGLDRPRALLVGPPLPDPVRLLTADITERAMVIAAVREVQPDAVYHLAGWSNPATAHADPPGILAANVHGQLMSSKGSWLPAIGPAFWSSARARNTAPARRMDSAPTSPPRWRR